MCYMSERERHERVGVRELRQNLSVYLRRVKAGETLEVTERGEPVAELRPRPAEHRSIIDRLIAEGKITPATRSHKDIPPAPVIPDPSGKTATQILLEMRDEDDR
jgi:prevent-host-death family protein